MSDKNPTYQEGLLHWVWKSLYFELTHLQTAEGLPLRVCHTGVHNHSDGPDFLNAELEIGSMKWFGDVEIHWKERDWYAHHHHKNSNFNRVILHIIYHHNDDKTNNPVIRCDQTPVTHTLHLKPYLTEPLQAFLDRFSRPGALPCSGHFSFISEEAFIRQLDKAQKLYFEQKIDDLLHFYDPDLPPSGAWINMLVTGMFDGFGVSHNRKAMQELCRELISCMSDISSRPELIDRAVTLSGINNPASSNYLNWKHKNCRPANRPGVRIPQAAECLWFIFRLPFNQWLKKDSSLLWDQLITQVQIRHDLGKERAGILYGTVWLPSFFILGKLFGAGSITSRAYNEWLNHRVKLPISLLNPFESLDIPADTYRTNLGAIYQLRSYCRPRKCEGCEVFKNAISS